MIRTQITADKGTKREVSMCHGYRKFFNTALMNSDVTHEFKEMMMGHSVKLDDVCKMTKVMKSQRLNYYQNI